MERIGIIAGGGELPIIFAKEVRKRGIKVIGFAVKEMALPSFDSACDRIHWLGIGEIKKFIFLLLAERIKKVIMLGKIDKSVIYGDKNKYKEALEALEGSKDRSDYSILDRVTHEFRKFGVELLSGIEFLSDLVPEKGVLTKKKPLPKEEEDISFGLKMVRELARLDIGQSIVVKDKSVISVEGMEGTDNTIERAAKICGENFTVVKVARPNQDMRWDVPVVGPTTLELIAKNKGKVLAIEEKRMFLIDKEQCVNIADKNDISVVVV